MAEIDTTMERERAAEAVKTYYRCGFVGNLPIAAATVVQMADELDRLRAENQRLTDEIESVLQLMDGLAEQWGDEAVFRRCRDRLRAAVEAAQEATE